MSTDQDQAAPRPEDFCQRCNRSNIVWFAPNEIWNKAVRATGQPEILCPVCFVELAEIVGITGVWKVSLQSTAALPEETADKGTVSDAEWDEYIDSLVEAHKKGVCNRATCAQCLQPGDPIDHWLS